MRDRRAIVVCIFFVLLKGIVGIIGGSPTYTGAPIFVAIGALKTGADLVHIFCDHSSAIPIKCYSPDFIVHSCFDSLKEEGNYEPFIQTSNKLNSIVVGPGLSANPNLQRQAEFVIRHALENDTQVKNIVFDADSFRFLPNISSDIWKRRCILTPNSRELHKLLQVFVRLSFRKN